MINQALRTKTVYNIARIFILWGLIAISTSSANESRQDLKGVTLRWPEARFTWAYSEEDEPNWLDSGMGLVLFQNAAAAWGSCGVEVKFQGIVKNKVTPKDQINTLGWAKLSNKIRGLTLRQRINDSVFIKEADIVINTVNLDVQNNPDLLQKVVTHEFGHALGLIHSEGCRDVMSSAAECGWRIANPPPLVPTHNDLAQCGLRYAAPHKNSENF